MRITELQYHGEVTWLNPTLAKGWKKGQGPSAHVFSEFYRFDNWRGCAGFMCVCVFFTM